MNQNWTMDSLPKFTTNLFIWLSKICLPWDICYFSNCDILVVYSPGEQFYKSCTIEKHHLKSQNDLILKFAPKLSEFEKYLKFDELELSHICSHYRIDDEKYTFHKMTRDYSHLLLITKISNLNKNRYIQNSSFEKGWMVQ